MSFLTAEWRKLAFANYIIDKDHLSQFIPAGTELDLWNGKCYISLVGFLFKNTRLFGIKIPFHTDFEEVNLRFYVKRFDNGQWKRGVVFIKEIVPRAALAFVANTVYKENYEVMPMSYNCREEANSKIVEYCWTKGGYENKFQVKATKESFDIDSETEAEFITEHYWGYAKQNDEETIEYEVTHPKWKVYNVLDYEIKVDYGAVYGNEFAFLNSMNPDSIMLAEGSKITVENRRTRIK